MCCRIFKSACVGKACCYVLTGATEHPIQRSSPLPGPSVSRTDAQSSTKVDAGRHEPLTLEIGGMDCVDCLPKVGKALSRLPSYVFQQLVSHSQIRPLTDLSSLIRHPPQRPRSRIGLPLWACHAHFRPCSPFSGRHRTLRRSSNRVQSSGNQRRRPSFVKQH